MNRNNVILFTAALIFSLTSAPRSRTFDWQYTRLSAPFAVFYNPALIGNNPGYTLGADFRHVDDKNYDVRGALVVPVSKTMTFEEHFNQTRNVNKHFRYSNTSYRSSATALSLGAIYAGEESYQFSAGAVTVLKNISSGLSFDLVYENDAQFMAMNAAISTDVPRVMRGGVLRLAFHNLFVSERTEDNGFGFSIGTGGVPFSDPRMYYLPYDLLFYFHMKDGKIDRVEGTARVSVDFSYLNTARGTRGQTFAGGVGYNYSRRQNGVIDHKFFVSLGVTFTGGSSTFTALGSYGEGDEKTGAAILNAFRRSAIADDGLRPALGVRETEGGVLFNLRTGGAPVRSWVLRIDNQKGGSVKTFSGGNVVPSSVIWDGLDGSGNPVSEELIFIRLVLHGEHRIAESEPVVIERGAGGRGSHNIPPGAR